MAKDGKRKVRSKSSTRYEFSSDDNASDEENNLRTLFANLNMEQKEKLNELISAVAKATQLPLEIIKNLSNSKNTSLA